MSETYTPAEVSSMAKMLIELGLHPSVVRQRLAEKGIHWEYQWRNAAGQAPQGMRQRIRNLKRQGLGLCTTCANDSYPLGAPARVCQACLYAKWNPNATNVRPE